MSPTGSYVRETARSLEPDVTVTVVVPTRNESIDLPLAIEALTRQDLPLDRVEVLVVDSGSEDDTRQVASAALEGRGFARTEVIENPGGSTPSNLNVGLSAAQTDILCRVDARSIIPPHYLRTCAEMLVGHPEIMVVGGSQVARPRTEDPLATGIARALNNRFGMGLSRYRRSATSGPSDTVYLGAFRVADLRRAGGWDLRMGSNQDFELNRRLGRAGEVWFCADLVVEYLPRPTLAALWTQYRRFGSWKVRYWTLTSDPPRPRQILILAAPPLSIAVMVVALLRWPRRVPQMLGIGLVLGAVVERRGTRDPSGGQRAHVVALAAMATIAGGWTLGAWTELWRRASGASRRRVFS